MPINVTFPTAATVPIGGCSIPTPVSVSNAPYSALSINYEFNTSLFTPSKFWINQ